VLQLESQWVRELMGSVVVKSRCENLVAEAGYNSGTQRKGNARRWSRCRATVSEDVNVDTTVCVCVCVCVIVNYEV
jgi:hypothetical protein